MLTSGLSDRLTELRSFDDVKLLTVMVDLLRQWWRPGLQRIPDRLLAPGFPPEHVRTPDMLAAATPRLSPSGRYAGGKRLNEQ